MRTRYVILRTSYIAGIFIIIVILAFAFSRSVTKPLQILAEGARRLAQGQLDTRVDIRSRDEFGDMARVFNSVGPRLEEHYKLLKSLDLAMEVQQNLLPKFDPQIKGLDVAGISDYCEETGGDYYDYLEVKQEEVSVVVGDVSGHGISSALLMTTARAFLRQRAAMPGSIREIVSDVNRRLSEDIGESGQFMTLFYSAIDLKQKVFRWVRAGHDAAFFYDGASDSFTQLDGGDLPLGVNSHTIMEIAGLDRGSQYDAFDIGGMLQLGGELDVTRYNLGGGLFDPQLGESFDLFAADTITGSFDLVTLAALGDGLGWQLEILPDAIGTTDVVRLNVVPSQVPVPPSVWLFGSGLLGLIGIARRRRAA